MKQTQKQRRETGKFADELIESLTEAAAHARGDKTEVRLLSLGIEYIQDHKDDGDFSKWGAYTKNHE